MILKSDEIPNFFWAKTTKEGLPGISVRQHNRIVGAVAGVLVDKFGFILRDTGLTKDAIVFLACSHDVGKISLDFQQKCRAWLEREGLSDAAKNGSWATLYTRTHPQISQHSLKKFFFDHGLGSRITGAVWSAIVGAHHGNVREVPTSRPLILKQQEKVLEAERQKALSEFYFDCQSPRFEEVGKESAGIWAVAGLLVLADWIGSDESFFSSSQELTDQEIVQKAQQAVDSIGLGGPQIRHGLTFADIFNGRSPYAMQSDTHELVSKGGVYVVEAPMGMGKTEAALYAAYKLLDSGDATGIYFALPSQATSNRMFLRFAEYAQKICSEFSPTTLLHGNSWLETDLKRLAIPDSVFGENNYNWFNGSRRAMFAPFSVGTVDQILLSIMPVKFFQLRRFALENKVVIIDEVHSYDSYTGTLVAYLCRELPKLGCTVIILSATLTDKSRCRLLDLADLAEDESILPYPRLTGVRQSVVAEEKTPPAPADKTVRICHEDSGRIAQIVSDSVLKGAMVLWICDTVDSAQKCYLDLKKRLPNDKDEPYCGLLHARFPFFVRDRLEQEWMTRFSFGSKAAHGAILVSTQIVEQSVDLDADIMVSELAPTDILLQRLGRLWRHSKEKRVVAEPLLYLIDESCSLEELKSASKEKIERALGAKGYVYSPYILLRSAEAWTNRSAIKIPGEIRQVMAETHVDRDLPASWAQLRDECEGSNMACEDLARMNANIWRASLDDNAKLPSRLSDRKDFLLALCEQTGDGRSIRLKEDNCVIDLNDKGDDLKISKKLHRNSVKISETKLAGFVPDNVLKKRFSIDGLLVVDQKGQSQSVEGKNCEIVWDDELGIVYQKVDK